MYRDDFYRLPELYDLEYSGLDEDLEHYRALARSVDSVLEFGAGSGRLTVPMAETGTTITAVDLSKPMLARLRQRVEENGLPIDIVHADFTTLALDERFPLVLMPFNAVHHVYEPERVLEVFEVVKRHMTPGGRFGIDLLIPNPDFFAREPDGVYEERVDADPDGGRMRSWENGYYDEITQINHIRYHFKRADGRLQSVNMPMRMFYPQEFLFLVRQAGFRLLQCDGDFQGTPLKRGAHKLVLVLTVD
jgi:SAM-dependent methyltransferase